MTPIEEQVEVLMSGTAYGDPATRQNMAADLRERLGECQREGRPLRVYCGYDPRTSDSAPGPHDNHAQIAPISRVWP